MTTHRKALTRVGVAAAAALGSLVVAGPAHADSNIGVKVSGQLVAFKPGDTQPLNVTVTNSSPPKAGSVAVSVSDDSNSLTASSPSGCDRTPGGACIIDFGATETSRNISFTLKATGSVDPGQSKPIHGTVTADPGLLGGPKANAGFDTTLTGPQPTQAPTVAQVTGTVKDSVTGSPVKGALVMLVDSGGGCGQGKCQTGTDNNGNFKFTPKAGQPIAPGSLQIGVTKSGYDNLVRNVDAAAGQSVSVQLALKPTADASASASAEALPSADAGLPSGDPTTAAAAAPNTQKASSNSGLSAFSWIILALAILLVLAGVGVFVMLFLNRRKRDDDGDGSNGPGEPTPMAGGGYGAAAPTMAGPAAMTQMMGSPGASDATAIIPPARPEDEFPDPYAAPYPTNMPGYAPAGNGYSAPAGYGEPTQVGGYQGGYDPTMQQGYGAPTTAYGPGGEYGNGYGGQAGYGAAPAGYGGEPAYGGQQAYGGEPGYGGSSTAYGGEPTAYAGQQPYGTPGGQAAGYDQPTGHWNGEEYPDAGAHGQQSGYPQQGGYDPRTAYGQQGGYEQAGGYDAAGYPPPQDPYRQEEPPSAVQPGAGRRGATPSGRGGDRQQLNWLDD